MRKKKTLIFLGLLNVIFKFFSVGAGNGGQGAMKTALTSHTQSKIHHTGALVQVLKSWT